MDYKEAYRYLEFIAINLTGDLATSDDQEAVVLEKYIDAIDIAQEVLKEKISAIQA